MVSKKYFSTRSEHLRNNKAFTLLPVNSGYRQMSGTSCLGICWNQSVPPTGLLLTSCVTSCDKLHIYRHVTTCCMHWCHHTPLFIIQKLIHNTQKVLFGYNEELILWGPPFHGFITAAHFTGSNSNNPHKEGNSETHMQTTTPEHQLNIS